MTQLSSQDVDRVRSLAESLVVLKEGDPSILATHLSAIGELIGAEKVAAYGLNRADTASGVDFMHVANWDREQLTAVMDEALRESPRGFGHYDPLLPDARQRNVALPLEALRTLTHPAQPTLAKHFPRLGVGTHDQLRVLVCDGDHLLAWVGGFRAEPFTAVEQERLSALSPALLRRLRLERQLSNAMILEAGLNAALEAVPTAAFILGAKGQVKHANVLGVGLLDVNRTGVLERLGKVLAGDSSADAEMIRLVLRGTSTEHTMVVLREGAPRLEPRLVAAKARWTLTRRQTEVLGHLVRGASNKSIAAALTCTVNTVEQHVTELLRRSDLDSRSALVAAFWTL